MLFNNVMSRIIVKNLPVGVSEHFILADFYSNKLVE